MKKTLASVYKNLFLNEGINAAPDSIDPLPRTHSYSRKNPRMRYPIHKGKGLKDAVYRIRECIDYLEGTDSPKKIIFKFNNSVADPAVDATIVLSPAQVTNLLSIYKSMKKSYERSTMSRRSLQRLKASRNAFKTSYFKELLKIYEDSHQGKGFLITNLSYIGYPGFEAKADYSAVYEANTVNNAVDVLDNIRSLNGAMIVTLHNLINIKKSPQTDSFYEDLYYYLIKIENENSNINFIIDKIYDYLKTSLNYNNLDDSFNRRFKDQITTRFSEYFKTDRNYRNLTSQPSMEDLDANIKTAIGFLIINLKKNKESAGIARNLQYSPKPEYIDARQVKASADNRSDLEFNFPVLTKKVEYNSETDDNSVTLEVEDNKSDNSLKIEIKAGLARGGSGTFWIAFKEEEHDRYIKSLKEEEEISEAMLTPISTYIFRGTGKSKIYFPNKTQKDSENHDLYESLKNKVNELFSYIPPDKRITLDIVNKNPDVFKLAYEESYSFEGNNYYLYYMGQTEKNEIRNFNYTLNLEGKDTNWLKTYYFEGKDNEYIHVGGSGLYLLAEPEEFKKLENREFGKLCKKEFKIPLMQEKDLSGLGIHLAGSRTGTKFEVIMTKKLAPSTQIGFEKSNQDFIYRFLLLASLAFNSQMEQVDNKEDLYRFIINNSNIVFRNAFNYISESKCKSTEKVLKEVYSHLFDKKLINEGGLAGHMMHPYEALDMTPRQIIDRIKEYSTSQKIIEKVDGQNLFFTVEQDGTLMFARNKEDMTHNDLVEKFTNHPAEVPFVTGGNAIKKGVDQWLSSAGAFGSQEILDIFHPDGEARSFINFEIMHKDHPNQLEYGENFIVFHSIVDFINGREAVYSSNNSQRLNKLISLMKPGVESSDYTLASNRTVDINKLTNVQITHYVDRIKEIANRLDITETEFLGDGVEKQIKKQLDTEGIDISDEAIKTLYDFALYGEDRLGNKIKSKDFTKSMKPDDVKKLRSINLTSANKAAAKVRSILSPFKDIFVDLGIDLLDGTPSAYMDSETDLRNIDNLRDKLETAIDDLRMYMNITPENEWDSVVNRLKPHYDKVVESGVYNTISTSVEGGVYDYQGDLLKVTGGFAPMNQILGAAYRDKKGIFPTFKQKFMQQESNRRSLKSVFNLIF